MFGDEFHDLGGCCLSICTLGLKDVRVCCCCCCCLWWLFCCALSILCRDLIQACLGDSFMGCSAMSKAPSTFIAWIVSFVYLFMRNNTRIVFVADLLLVDQGYFAAVSIFHHPLATEMERTYLDCSHFHRNCFSFVVLPALLNSIQYRHVTLQFCSDSEFFVPSNGDILLECCTGY